MKSEIIMHIPHSSKAIPSEYMEAYHDVAELNETLLKLTDTYTDELFAVDGVEKIIFPYSRTFCDVERFLQDEPMESKFGQGYYYTNGINLKPFRTEINKETVRDKYYTPHHAFMKETIRKLNNPLLIDCHSFSDEIYKCSPFESRELPDICLGVNEGDYHAQNLCSRFYDYFTGQGLKTAINFPYSGSFQIDKVPSVMIEINKRLYLHDDLLTKRSDFYKTKALVKFSVKKIQEYTVE